MVPRLIACFLISLIAALPLARASSAADEGAIEGTVLDAETGETLIGANVVIAETTTGSTTNLEGEFEIRSLDPGTYDLVVSYIGYSQQQVDEVEVAAGETTRIAARLQPEALDLDEVVVEARAVRGAEAALLRERQKAASVGDAIGAEAMSRAGNATASDALKRVTGASVVDGRYVYVRGLGERYVNTRLNGATMPSSDPDRNAVPLDLFPASLLENIVTTKTFTPDQPGNFTGGSVDVGTKDYPDEFTLSFSSSIGGEGQAFGAAQILDPDASAGGQMHLTGRPSELPHTGGPSPNHVQARRDPEAARALDNLARSFTANMAPDLAAAPLERSHGLSVGNRISFLGKPLGFLGSLTYDADLSSYSSGNAATYLLTGDPSQVNQLNLQQDLADMRTTSDVLWGGLGRVAYQPHANHSFGVTLLYNRSTSNESRYLTGSVPRNFAPERRLESRVLMHTERSIGSLQFEGAHELPGIGGIDANWLVSRSATRQNEPDARFFANDYTIFSREGRADTMYSVAISNYTAPTRYFRELEENGWDAALNLTLPLNELRGEIKWGGSLNLRDRTFGERRFEYVVRVPYEGDPAAFFDRVGVVDSTAGPTGTTYQIGNYLIDATSPRNNYEGTQSVQAGYGMIDVHLLSRLRLITGIRLERTDLQVQSRDSTIAHAGILENDWLPSLNLVYEMGRANLRAAYGKTLARPTFRELAPFTSFAYINAPTLSGNPDLQRTLVHNVDLRWELFPRPGEVFAISAFYKLFLDPIERTILNNNFETRFENVDEARVLGMEFEARKRLDDVWRPLRGFEIGGNVTITQSRVDVPADELVQIRSFDPNAKSTRQLQGQSPYVVNADVTYQAPSTTVSLFYNVFGRRLSDVSLGGTPNVYELPFHALDFTVTQHLIERVRVRASVRNVLDASVQRAYPFKGTDYLASSYQPGRSVSLGIALSY